MAAARKGSNPGSGPAEQHRTPSPYSTQSSSTGQPSSATSASGKARSAKSSSATEMKEGPVKAACLSCRAKKAKCDGIKPVCGACVKKGLKCEYVKSRRGGPRKRRAPTPSALQQFLSRLDSFWMPPALAAPKDDNLESEDTTNIVRVFSSRDEILRCYYNEVHAFLPMMPVRKWFNSVLVALPAQSPFLLAATTILVLVPHPRDPNPGSANSRRLRSITSNVIANQAVALIDQLINAGKGNIECVQALTILSLWQWSSTLDLKQTMSYAERATSLAMKLGLHQLDKSAGSPRPSTVEAEDWRRDMARRTWWYTYSHQLQSSLASGNIASISHEDAWIHTDYPASTVSDKSWGQYVDTIRACVRVLNTVVSVYFAKQAQQASGNEISRQLLDIDAEILEMLKRAENESVVDLVPGSEEEVVRNQQLSARLAIAVLHIHVHRHQAFPEVSLFSKMMCGLPEMAVSSPVPSDTTSSTISDPSVYPSDLSMTHRQSVGSNNTTSELSTTLYSDPFDGGSGDSDMFAFTNDLWQPETYPEQLPEPWFAHSGGAAALYAPVEVPSHFASPLPPTILNPSGSISPTSGIDSKGSKDGSPQPSTSSSSASKSSKTHKAWGVDTKDRPEKPTNDGLPMVFPPGVSLERCATAAHAIIRLEVLHRSAVIAMWEGQPKWLPFCSCGLVTGAYAFLLLALAVQAENAFRKPDSNAIEQIEGLLTNVKVIVAGLEAYGTMWEGINTMAREVRAALEAAEKLPEEMRAQMAQYRDSQSRGSSYERQIENNSTKQDESTPQKQSQPPVSTYQQQTFSPVNTAGSGSINPMSLMNGMNGVPSTYQISPGSNVGYDAMSFNLQTPQSQYSNGSDNSGGSEPNLGVTSFTNGNGNGNGNGDGGSHGGSNGYSGNQYPHVNGGIDGMAGLSLDPRYIFNNPNPSPSGGDFTHNNYAQTTGQGY